MVDYDVLWQTIESNLPDLIAALDRVLKEDMDPQ